jgi:alkyl hydroperoxide reductase subunit F
MLDANIKTQLKAYLEKLRTPIELVASLDDSAAARELHSLLSEIAELSDKVSCARTATPRGAPPSPSAVPARWRASPSPACRWATNSPR